MSNETTGSYSVGYVYDIVGNRTRREIIINGQCMQTDYEYNDCDQLIKEMHTDPGVCFYLHDKPVYAYASGGDVMYYRLAGSSEN
ncbi:MAG: hypothetical protein JXA96_10360, partial [Sedimentisphaerales bacterium]|nr:hypothetical protein [Sedimentisphaerales bacterium]